MDSWELRTTACGESPRAAPARPHTASCRPAVSPLPSSRDSSPSSRPSNMSGYDITDGVPVSSAPRPVGSLPAFFLFLLLLQYVYFKQPELAILAASSRKTHGSKRRNFVVVFLSDLEKTLCVECCSLGAQVLLYAMLRSHSLSCVCCFDILLFLATTMPCRLTIYIYVYIYIYIYIY